MLVILGVSPAGGMASGVGEAGAEADKVGKDGRRCRRSSVDGADDERKEALQWSSSQTFRSATTRESGSSQYFRLRSCR